MDSKNDIQQPARMGIKASAWFLWMQAALVIASIPAARWMASVYTHELLHIKTTMPGMWTTLLLFIEAMVSASLTVLPWSYGLFLLAQFVTKKRRRAIGIAQPEQM